MHIVGLVVVVVSVVDVAVGVVDIDTAALVDFLDPRSHTAEYLGLPVGTHIVDRFGQSIVEVAAVEEGTVPAAEVKISPAAVNTAALVVEEGIVVPLVAPGLHYPIPVPVVAVVGCLRMCCQMKVPAEGFVDFVALHM